MKLPKRKPVGGETFRITVLEFHLEDAVTERGDFADLNAESDDEEYWNEDVGDWVTPEWVRPDPVLIRIWHGDECSTNASIKNSEKGKRDLVPLHRLRAVKTGVEHKCWSELDLRLECVFERAGNALDLPLKGVFNMSVKEAERTIEEALQDYVAWFRRYVPEEEKQEMAAARRKEEAENLDLDKAQLRKDIEAYCARGEPHSRLLCRALDGLHGKRLQKWAEKELARCVKVYS